MADQVCCCNVRHSSARLYIPLYLVSYAFDSVGAGPRHRAASGENPGDLACDLLLGRKENKDTPRAKFFISSFFSPSPWLLFFIFPVKVLIIWYLFFLCTKNLFCGHRLLYPALKMLFEIIFIYFLKPC